MMVNCPKCGFSQDQDQYCASCGVDMVAYRPAQKPFYVRLATNTVFQMGAVSVVIFVVFAYVREQNHKEHLARLELAKKSEHTLAEKISEMQRRAIGAPVVKESVPENPAGDSASFAPPPPPVVVEAASTSTANTIAPPAPAGGAATVSAAARGKPAASASPAAVAKAADSLRISVIEAQRPFINDLLANAGQVAIAGTISVGVVTGIQGRLANSRGEASWRALESSPFQNMRLNQPNMVFKGVRDPSSGHNLGFTIQVMPAAQDDQGTLLQVDILRVLRAADPAAGGVEETTLPLPEGFTVPAGGAIVIAGALPHRALSEAEDRLYRGANVLRVMSGEPFRSGATEAVILIETK